MNLGTGSECHGASSNFATVLQTAGKLILRKASINLYRLKRLQLPTGYVCDRRTHVHGTWLNWIQRSCSLDRGTHTLYMTCRSGDRAPEVPSWKADEEVSIISSTPSGNFIEASCESADGDFL